MSPVICFARNFLMAVLLIAIVGAIGFGISWKVSDFYQISGVPVLNYHAVNDDISSDLVIRTDQFKAQMDYLDAHGYHTITLKQLDDYLTKGESLPDKPVLLTFDDGYVDNYYNVLPVLKAHHMHATLFMIGDAIGEGGRFVTADQLREMDANGFDVQAHTYTHKKETQFGKATLIQDFSKGRDVLEALLHKKIDYMAYPGGFNNAVVRDAAKEAGFRMAFTVEPGNVSPGDDLYQLNRLAIFEWEDPMKNFIWRLHEEPLARALWKLRDHLQAYNYPVLASYVPLF